jgi:hypothetical protein
MKSEGRSKQAELERSQSLSPPGMACWDWQSILGECSCELFQKQEGQGLKKEVGKRDQFL